METAQLWTQNYAPIGGNLWLSTAAALIPVVFFFVALVGLRLKGYVAGAITVLLAFLVAVFGYGVPIAKAVMATLYGFGYGLWPISWIILTAVFLYKIAVKTGQFAVIRESVLSITHDQRLLVVLIGFCFGAFLEGAAGFGAPVAITAALLVGLGLNPLYAAGLCLIANTAPVAFGALGIPITVAGNLTGIDPHIIGQIAGRQLPLLALFVPFFMVFVMDGLKGVRQTWPALLVAGFSFALTQFLTSNYLGPQLPDITSALVSLVATAGFLKFWQPSEVQPVPDDVAAATAGVGEEVGAPQAPAASEPLTTGRVIKAWSPFLLLTLFVIVWTLPAFKALFDAKTGGALAETVLHWDVPGVHNEILKVAPIVAEPTPYAATYKLDLISATGTSIFLAALASMAVLGMGVRQGVQTFTETVRELFLPILSIMLVLGFAYIANYSGQSATLALALAQTGQLFPLFSPVLGWLGVFLTGSDTSSNALFSNLQYVTAQQIGVNPALMVAANTTGGVTGKMISPQSIAVATAAVGLVGKESDLFRFTVRKSLGFLAVIMLITYLQAYVVPGMIPLP
ncbi:lactate permease LctP family transporter [Deinococcus sp. SL84]|uniref:lactate permease LctP family transporter n=1 Tax=Deinococcus sp. SL84 TaxID=2994663 RepID=UPI002274C528|nr:lactate permease LctP family transporter [Deinococcus sp. SL84]MCY1704245.1 lactate permease LctP family transporter [Deinococcus sp. SL84]